MLDKRCRERDRERETERERQRERGGGGVKGGREVVLKGLKCYINYVEIEKEGGSL